MRTPRLAPLAASLAALLAATAPAAASVVDPWETTLSSLTQAADVIATARRSPTPDAPYALAITGVLWSRSDHPAPARATGDACIASEMSGEGLVFLALEADGRCVALGSSRGFVVGDAAAEAFVRAAVAAEGAERSARLGLLVAATSSPSPRVRADALRDVARALRSADPGAAPRLTDDATRSLVASARAALADADPEPALAVLAALPGGVGDAALVEAARSGVDPRSVGFALRGRAGAVAALAAALDDLALDPERASGVAIALGYARDRRATPALTRYLAWDATRRASLDALVHLRDPEAVPALKPLLLEASAMSDDVARVAVALAYTGGDEAIGALEFARWNHPDVEIRRFIERLMVDPAGVRAGLE